MPAPGAQWTYQANLEEARHNWLHLTPAYAAGLVSSLLADYDPHDCNVLDPFLGSGTTPIRAGQLGFASTGWDINPFLLEVVQAKSTTLSDIDARRIFAIGEDCAASIDETDIATSDFCPEPPMHNLDRWWPLAQRLQLRRLKTAVQGAQITDSERRLLRCAFAAAVKTAAQVDHKHHSLSYSSDNAAPVDNLIRDHFLETLQHFLIDCQTPLPQKPSLLRNDARQAQGSTAHDLVICSPPYPNRMSYMRELRPYLYWLDYLEQAHECADLDWLAIGGTWGTATNRLKTWSSDEQGHLVPALTDCLQAIPEQGSSALIKQYLIRYSHDMLQHFQALRFVLKPDAKIHYVVGNANYYGVGFPSDELYCQLLEQCGYREISSRVLRRRSSSKQLFEYCISATAPIACCR